MNFVEGVVKHPVTIIMVFLVLIGGGFIGLVDIPINYFPEADFPIIQVTTAYPGAGPREVETNVTRELEASLSSVSGIEQMTSTSSENFSSITLEFGWGSDLTEKTNEIRDELEVVSDNLPDDAEQPRILKFDPASQPIIDLAISGELASEELRRLAEDVVQPRIEQVTGVGQVELLGGRERQVRVDLLQNRLQAHGITANQVARSLEAQNQEIGAGEIDEGERNLLLRTSGEFQSLDEIRNTVVAYGPPARSRGRTSQLGRPILLRDLAEVSFGLSEAEEFTYFNGEPAVNLSVRKQSGTNTVEVADLVKEEMAQIRETLPTGATIHVAEDSSSVVRSALADVSSSLTVGLGFAILILFIFLRNLQTTFIIGLSIPISLVLTLGAMYFTGITLNVATLSGLILGLGMIVDSSIVILENVYTKRSTGMSVHAAAISGTKEMITPISAASLTTISVFLPIILLRGDLDVIGIIFGNIAITVVYTILAALVVAALLTPVLSSTYIPLSSPQQREKRSAFVKRLNRPFDRFFDWLDDVYARGVRGVLHHRGTTLTVAFTVLVSSLLLFGVLDVMFTPSISEDSTTVQVELPVGTRVEKTEEVMLQLEELVAAEFNDTENILVTAGGGGGFFGGSSSEHYGELTVNLKPLGVRTESIDDVERFVRSQTHLFPGTEIGFSGGQQEQILGTDPIDVSVISNDLEAATATAYDIQRLMIERFPEITEPDLSVSEALPELEVVIDRQRAYSFGLNVATIGQEIRANVDGVTATEFRSAGEELDVFVSLQEADRSDVPDLEKIFLNVGTGESIPLSNFATLRRRTGPVSIEREDEQRIVHVTGGLREGYTPVDVESRLRASVEQELTIPDSVRLDFAGEQAQIEEIGSVFLLILAIAVALVFSVMASQFESFRSPFIIVFTIPLMLIGAITIYLIMGQPFSMFSFMGLIMLAGIVVNNGIVLVDYINLLRVRGYDVLEACVEAGRSRLRPILMTTFTTMFGMVPLAFFPGEAAVATQPVAITIVGGLVSSTPMTLFVVPVLYYLIAGKHPVRKEDPAAVAAGQQP